MKQLLLTNIFFLSILIAWGQKAEVKGIVLDDETGQPLPFGSAVVPGDGGGLIGEDGTFVFPIPDNYDSLKLVFSYVGYQNKEVSIAKGDSVTIRLKPVEKKLDEVMITALGVKRQKKEIGYSTDKIEGDAIAVSNAPNQKC